MKIVSFFKHEKVLLILIILLALALRLTGVNWDQSKYLHPDERFMIMTATGVDWPDSVGGYFDVHNSPLSPYNKNYSGYVYGTFPLFLVKAIGEQMDLRVYGNLHLAGRVSSAIIDIGTLLLVFGVAKRLKGGRTGLLAALIYSVTVYSIQHSHFFTVENFLVFFLMLTFTSMHKSLIPKRGISLIWIILAGMSFGLALGSKVSAIVFSPIIVLLLLLKLKLVVRDYKILRSLLLISQYALIMVLFGYISFRLTNPYFFESNNWLHFGINPLLKESMKFFLSASKGIYLYPPSWQWIDKPFWFAAKNLAIWSIGIPLTTLFIAGIGAYLHQIISRFKKYKFSKPISTESLMISIVIIWITLLLMHISISFVKSTRYLLPLSPFIAIIASYGADTLISWRRLAGKYIVVILVSAGIMWAAAFTNIYTKDSTRVAATKWIYANISDDNFVGSEHWDDAIPLNLTPEELSANSLLHRDYGGKGVQIGVFDPDEPPKIQSLYQNLDSIDYLFVTSARARDTVGKLPDRFPYMGNYYSALDNGTIGFELVEEFTSYPSLFGIKINDSTAEEAIWVYDHPKVWIYRKVELVELMEFEGILTSEIF